MSHYTKTGRKGHGCCGGIVALFLVVVAVFSLLFFCTDVFSGLKDKVMMYFYPQDYSQYVTQYAEEYDVDEALVYAVIKTESGFREDVESSVGAIGLMQIMPDTFEWLQTLSDSEVTYTENDLKNPQINIKYGTYYLSFLLDHYDGREMLAIAAYNGGVANVDKWLKDTNYSADGLTLTDIPYEETKNYVERVEDAKNTYKTLYYDNK
ncbi:MAG: lytic transglycosylase domain-containing protein [Eubacteriales bacterium]|nr:lytic transglycosylase domain-containing protein [Eubacteriales bacterium]